MPSSFICMLIQCSMAKTRPQKEVIVERIAQDFKNMKSAAFSSISGFGMAQADALRTKAEEKDIKVFVAKKTLLKIAAKEAGFDLDTSALKGSILTAVAFGDDVGAAKLLKELTKENEAVSLVSGFLEGRQIGSQEVNQLALLPSREELYAKLVGSINAPVSGFVNVLAGNLRGLVTVLGAISEKKG